jgi:hypothetical protein
MGGAGSEGRLVLGEGVQALVPEVAAPALAEIDRARVAPLGLAGRGPQRPPSPALSRR